MKKVSAAISQSSGRATPYIKVTQTVFIKAEYFEAISCLGPPYRLTYS